MRFNDFYFVIVLFITRKQNVFQQRCLQRTHHKWGDLALSRVKKTARRSDWAQIQHGRTQRMKTKDRYDMGKKEKVKEADLYSAFTEVPYTQGAQVRITVLPANYTVPASIS